MSILGFNGSSAHTSNSTMSSLSNSRSPFFHEFKKQASFYIKEKIKTARLALTDVTPAQILTEEVTNANPSAPDTKTMGLISRAAFEVDDYWRIVEILHTRLSKFDRNNWRPSYKTLIVLEHLVTHGPESAAEEFQDEKIVIKQMQLFQHIDEKGFNWGLAVRKKSERLLELLEKGPLLKEERNRARKLTRGIQGFGRSSSSSYTWASSSAEVILQESTAAFGRSHSQVNEHGNDQDNNENIILPSGYNNDSRVKDEPTKKTVVERAQPKEVIVDHANKKWLENSKFRRNGSKENMAPSPLMSSGLDRGEFHRWDEVEESNSLLGNESGKMLLVDGEEDHPFIETEKQGKVSLLAVSEVSY